MTAERRFSGALRALASAFSELEAPAMIIGGMAVIAAGVPRETIDIDATILGRDAPLDDVIAVLGKYGIVGRIEDAKAFAQERQIPLLRHVESGVAIELSFAWLPFEEEALRNARAVDIAGTELRIARPEDLIIYKAAAWRDRDRSDIERLLVLHLDTINLTRVRALIAEIASVLGEPARVDSFDELVARARRARG